MRSDPRCVPCIFNQVLSGAKRVTDDEAVISSAYHAVAALLPELSLCDSPAWISYLALKAANKAIDCDDPYREEKEEYNRKALEGYSGLCSLVRESEDPLHTALKVAVAGNIIDLGILKSFDIERTLKEVLASGFRIDHYDDFKRELAKANNVLYLLDNAGEIVFDMVLMEQLKGCDITAVVNEGPIINDVTMEDANAVGLDKAVEVITSGSDTIGKPPEKGSEKYRSVFKSADMIIAKGHGNYETMEGIDANIFFVLRAKCDVVAEHLGVKLGDVVLKYARK